MSVPFWYSALAAELAKCEAEVGHRREVASADPVASGIEWATRRLRAALDELLNAKRLLTPEEWGASQPVKIPAQTVRRWIRLGELDAVPAARGSLVPSDAKRIRRDLLESA